jgi:hypothetical protein
MAHKQATQAEVIQALQEMGGIVSEAAKKLGLASSTGLRERIKRNPALKAAVDEIREDTKDLSESVILDALKARDKDMAKWYLASLARDRGFGNKQEIEVKGKLEVEAVDLGRLSGDELRQLEELVKKTSDAGTG